MGRITQMGDEWMIRAKVVDQILKCLEFFPAKLESNFWYRHESSVWAVDWKENVGFGGAGLSMPIPFFKH